MAKCCFELTDFGTHAAVSVVTKNGESDDANGCDIERQNFAYLRVCRVGRAFSFHYSLDGEHFHMIRYFLMKEAESVKVGLLAQHQQVRAETEFTKILLSKVKL